MIQDTSLTTLPDLYGYHRHPTKDVTHDQIRYYANRSKSGFPSLGHRHLQQHIVCGQIIIRQNGTVQSIHATDDHHHHHLLGYKTKDMVKSMHIDRLLPHFMTLMARRISLHRTATPVNDDLQTTMAVHMDGTLLDVALQVQWLEDDNLYSIWIAHRSTPASPINTQHVDINQGNKNNNTNDHQQAKRRSIPTLARFESFGLAASTGLPAIVFPDFDEYTIIKSLGQGTFGAALLVALKSDPSQEFVIKAIMKSRIIVDSWIRDRRHGLLPLEIHILLKLQQHPHVNCPRLLTFMEDDDNYYVVMTRRQDRTLFDAIEQNDRPMPDIRRIFHQVAAAVAHLHHLGIVHRDIKDTNILLNDTDDVLLIDFGSAAYYRPGRLFTTLCGTRDCMAPEILRSEPYAGPPQDIWSLGVLLYTLIYREMPLGDSSPSYQGHGAAGLLAKLLDGNANQRPTIDLVMQDPWLQTNH
ncbi:hypothetical protein [Absidia glauca]|uniref:Protein kinase domain-containing protein n=1 Tax=Absidia glauca TaxID=4829 RepID=A0A163K127_ABSGL|nr:hypothetical protein [Absidia glauca]